MSSCAAGDLPYTPEITPAAQELIDSVGAEGELLRLLHIRVPDLIAYQNLGYARQYTEFVRRVMQREGQIMPGSTQMSEAVARYLYKLMAYKDEYEVARLSLQPALSEELKSQFGENAQVRYMLHPPILRAMGLNRKLALGKWFDTFYHLLTRMKGLRGTPLDVFGYAKVRRVERQLIGQYRGLIEEAVNGLTTENYEDAVRLAGLPDVIRGYEDIKLGNVEKFWREVEALQTQDKVAVTE
jgi:indolepyruvate ferredoxin oxidoreductase